jgi:hypothetical protein
MNKLLAVATVLTLAASAAPAHANSTYPTAPAPAPTEAPAPEPIAAPLQEAPKMAPSAKSKRARFSGGRLVVEMLAGGLVGGLTGYAAYSAVGGDDIGSVLAGLGANIAVTPLVVYGTGRAMGGQGTLGMSYLGGLIAFSGPSATPDQAAVSFAVGMTLMPVTSALMFELSSHIRSKRFETVARGISVAPVIGGSGLAGAKVGLGFAF